MKTYVLTVSRQFPKTHKRAGEPTFFVEKIFEALGDIVPCEFCYRNDLCIKSEKHCLISSMSFNPKLHTIRANYELWAKRAEEINEGKAILSVRYWSEKPYRSKQVEICKLEKIGVQKIIFDCKECAHVYLHNEPLEVEIKTLTQNDGLSFDNFKDWFKNYDLSKTMAIIQFTDFRY